MTRMIDVSVSIVYAKRCKELACYGSQWKIYLMLIKIRYTTVH